MFYNRKVVCIGVMYAACFSICEQWVLQAPLGAAELYREGSCCWRCLSPTSLMIRGHCPVLLPELYSSHIATAIVMLSLDARLRKRALRSQEACGISLLL